MLKDEIEVELREMEPKPIKLQEKLTTIGFLIEKLPKRGESVELKPTFEEFSQRLGSIVEDAMKRDSGKVAGLKSQIDAIRDMAKDAWSRRDPLAWHRINEQLDSITQALAPPVSAQDRMLGFAAWIIHYRLPEIEKATHGRYSGQISDIKEEVLLTVVMSQMQVQEPEAVMAHLRSIYQQKIVPLCRQAGIADEAPPKVLPRAAMGAGSGGLTLE